jgi:uncharacterized membrane protein YjfL (UPF0719 family)
VFSQATGPQSAQVPELMNSVGRHLVSGVVFALVGLVVFSICLWAIARFAPFSVRREIEQDQNIALAIIVGAALIGVSIIIAAAIQG